LTIAVSLAQIGEFSFILASLGVSQGLLSTAARDVILAAAIVSILINPVFFMLLDKQLARMDDDARNVAGPDVDIEFLPTTQVGHTVVVGYGRVGHEVVSTLVARQMPLLVIEMREEAIESLRAMGVEVVPGQAATNDVLHAARLGEARAMIIAIPDPFEAGEVVRVARLTHPALTIVARAHAEEFAIHLRAQGASAVVLGERELARSMVASLA
jgi:CPA2 family monovalent cation:H+ antiporter-2